MKKLKLNNLNVKNVKNRAKITSKYQRKGFFEINSVIKKIQREKGKKKYFKFENFKIKTSTQKNNLFISNFKKYKNKCKCDICGKKAHYFSLEKSINSNNIYHFNLYTIDPKTFQEIYFNIDHIKPKSKGGTNTIDNMQLTCEKCNSKKADKWNKWLFLLKNYKYHIKKYFFF